MNSLTLQINLEYKKLVKPLPQLVYEDLKESIKESGKLWIPILVNPSGIILDGHHRYQICKELGITPTYAVREFSNKLLEKKFVIEVNLKRRQLNDFEKSELGIPLMEIEKELAQLRQHHKSELNGEKGQSRDIIAKKIGISGTTFERAKTIIEKAPEQVKQPLREGKTTISKEYQKIQKDTKKQQRHEALQSKQLTLPDTVTLFNQDFEKSPIPLNSVSLIITDPPYHEKYLYLYDKLGQHAARVLRDGGSLLVMQDTAIGKIINMMESHGLKFHWPIAVVHSGPSASVFGRKILVGYKPMLWFVKGKHEGEFVRDLIQSEFQGKELHEWAQSTKESDYYIKYLTIENEIVYDPFMGQGTFGVSAVSQNRQFIGCEIEQEHFENAKKMIANAQ